MKKLILIGGTMGVGKTTVSQKLMKELDHSVFLDGDWCWNMHPFVVNDETKEMVMDNICYVLNNFIHCHSYDNIIFCWVMHEQMIIDNLLKRLDTKECEVYCISLVCSLEQLTKQIQNDIDLKIREKDVLERSLNRLSLYQSLNNIKIDTSNLKINEIILKIKEVIS